MSYISAKERLLDTVRDEIPFLHTYYNGRQVIALYRYLAQVAPLHDAISYKALKEYVNSKYVENGFPLLAFQVLEIVEDVEKRRTMTLLIMKSHKQRIDVMNASTFVGTLSGRGREVRWKRLTNEIESIWPNKTTN